MGEYQVIVSLANDGEHLGLRSRSGVASFTAELPKGGVEVRPLPDWAFWI